MTATILDGKAFAAALRQGLGSFVETLKQQHNITPGLAVVLVGEDPASQVYVRNKHASTIEAGMASFEFRLPATTSQDELEALIDELNAREDVNGILVQLPLPKGLDDRAIIERIRVEKDVDGFHIENVGMLAAGVGKPLVPCTPLGSLLILQDHLGDLSGLNAVVLGRSNIVGKPMAQLLLSQSATVEICHSRTKDLAEHVRRADILVAAVGRPEMVPGDWIKPGATVIDVGINRIDHPEKPGKSKLVGDAHTASCAEVAGAITPVPGGIGPMTIACLLANTLTATCRQHGLSEPDLLALVRQVRGH